MPHNVKIYTLSTCGHCSRTKKFFNDCAIEYEYKDVDLMDGAERTAIIDELKKLNPNCTFPTIVIDGKVIVGFSENEIREALGL